MNKTEDKIYRAAIYVRLSKEDGDSFSFGKKESDSITNQKALIHNWLEKMPDIEITAVFEDDGYTGTNFDRKGFQEMVEAIRQRRIDCVVVKDFSRLGRDYLEAGKYIEKIFPAMGVRFISINDDYDSLYPKGQTDSLIVPFKNLMNEQYSRDTSGKTRSALRVKRQQGMLVSNFAVFGYLKDPENKNHLVVDEYAAKIVQDIFKWKIDGLSLTAIAKRLTEYHIPAPADYKRQCGINYRTPFKISSGSPWTAVAVKRILTNEIYCGHLTQGRHRKKSYKIKVQELLDESQWERVENTHEAIISSQIFYEVRRLLCEDTRVGPGNVIYPLAGKVCCAGCGASMVRKMVPCGETKYFYYVCGNHKKNRSWCAPHSIRAEKLEKAVLASVQAQIAICLDMEKALDEIDHLAWEQREVKKLTAQIDALDGEIERNQELKLAVYEDLKEGLIDKTEYRELRKGFSEKVEAAKKARKKLKEEQNALLNGMNGQQEFLEMFKKYQNIQELTRHVVVAFVNKVLVCSGDEISVVFRYQDRFSSIADFLEKRQGEKSVPAHDRKEA